MILPIRRQASRIYRLLLRSRPLTAYEIGKELNIFPNAVYRETKTLEALSCIKSVGKYPVKFIANSIHQAVESLLFVEREQFLKSFSMGDEITKGLKNESKKNLDILFVKNWQSLNEYSSEDVSTAKKEINLIVSDLEAPVDTILEYKKAFERGASIKILVQKSSNQNEDMFKNWQKLGIDIRFCEIIEARLFLIDYKIVYLVSFNPINLRECVGVRFNSRPIALLLQGLFNERWKTAEKI